MKAAKKKSKKSIADSKEKGKGGKDSIIGKKKGKKGDATDDEKGGKGKKGKKGGNEADDEDSDYSLKSVVRSYWCRGIWWGGIRHQSK